jgi:hypothetical protein
VASAAWDVWQGVQRGIGSLGRLAGRPAWHRQLGTSGRASSVASGNVDCFRAALKRKHPATNKRAGCSIVFEIVSETISWLSAYYATYCTQLESRGIVP